MKHGVIEINLNDISNKEVQVISGRSRGEATRKKFKIEKIEEEHNQVKVIIPKECYCLNSSFLLGLFGKSIRKFGSKKFKEVFVFVNDENHREEIEEAITRALMSSNSALGEMK